MLSGVLTGNLIKSTVIKNEINGGGLYSRINKCKAYRHIGLVKKGRKSKNTRMKKKNHYKVKELMNLKEKNS